MKKIMIAICICFISTIAFSAEPATPATNAGPPPGELTPPPRQQPQMSLLPGLQAQPPATAVPVASPARIGVVDIQKISNESEIGKKGQGRIKDMQAKLQKQVDARKKQLEKAKLEIERQMPSLSPQQRDAKAKEFQKKVEDFQKFGMKSEKELMTLQEKLTKELLASIEKNAAAYGQDAKLSAIVVRQEVIYASGTADIQDITDDVVKRMNETAPK